MNLQQWAQRLGCRYGSAADGASLVAASPTTTSSHRYPASPRLPCRMGRALRILPPTVLRPPSFFFFFLLALRTHARPPPLYISRSGCMHADAVRGVGDNVPGVHAGVQPRGIAAHMHAPAVLLRGVDLVLVAR
ncbi:hypothetical protein ACLOJK_028893 [Asimina triloba]